MTLYSSMSIPELIDKIKFVKASSNQISIFSITRHQANVPAFRAVTDKLFERYNDHVAAAIRQTGEVWIIGRLPLWLVLSFPPNVTKFFSVEYNFPTGCKIGGDLDISFEFLVKYTKITLLRRSEGGWFLGS